jgi:hypothetical protein
MTTIPAPALEALPAIIFQFSSSRLELLNRDVPVYPGLTRAKLGRILRGEWQKLVPEEFHPVVRKLASLSDTPGYTTVEFPVYWMGNTAWLRVYAAAASEPGGKRTIIGLVQDVTFERHLPVESESPSEAAPEGDEEPFRKMRHEINGSLTTILMNCEMLHDHTADPATKKRIAAILSETLRVDQYLQQFTG